MDLESELGGTSDTGRGKAGVRVRTWGNFGQRKGKSAFQSRNQVQLLALEAKMSDLESEPVATSDTGSLLFCLIIHGDL